MSIIDEIAAERRRQVEAEGWTPAHDDTHTLGELALAASEYAGAAGLASAFAPRVIDTDDCLSRCPPPIGWPLDKRWWKPTSRRKALVKAAALIVAEIERLDRKAGAKVEGE